MMTSTDGPGPVAWPADPGLRLERLVHDLRTPLTIVTGFADLLGQRTDLTDAQRAEFLARVAEAAHQLQQILDTERADRRS
jgi:signal transduction histidine kinase